MDFDEGTRAENVAVTEAVQLIGAKTMRGTNPDEASETGEFEDLEVRPVRKRLRCIWLHLWSIWYMVAVLLRAVRGIVRSIAIVAIMILLLLALANVVCAETAHGAEWDKTFGGTGTELASSVQQTTDGGYILAGRTESYGAGDNDFWLVKTDSDGKKEWDKTFGGTGEDWALSVQQTIDSGYILAGKTESYGAGSSDFWLVKTDSDGKKEWDKTFGGTGEDWARSVQQTIDSGYILAGKTESYGAGSSDFWLVKTDSDGKKEWDKTFGGTGEDWASSVQQTTDGGYILAGRTESYGAGSSDFWLVKTDSNGKKEWDKTFGGTGEDQASSVQQTTDGDYILAGDTKSYGAGSNDIWLVKTDPGGNEVWNRTFGGTDWDGANSVQQTTDGGYILTGETTSYGAGQFDFWLVKTDSNGKKEWDKTFGGFGTELAFSNVQQTSDGGYILAGITTSYGAGSSDFWLVKVRSTEQEALYAISEAKSAISKAEPAIASANQIGADTTEAQSLLGRAEIALSDGEYQSAISYATQAEASAKKSRTKQLGIYAATILIAILIIAISLKATANVRERRRTVEAERRRKEEEENHRREEAKQKILDKIKEVI